MRVRRRLPARLLSSVRMSLPATVSRKAQSGCASAAFTLLEILIATASFAVILAALNAAFYAAIRLRSRTTALVENVIPMNQAVAIIKRDLRGILTSGTLAGAINEEKSVSVGQGQSSRLEFYTTSGVVDDEHDWGDMQKVSYYLSSPQTVKTTRGQDLIRAITRNLLASGVQDLDERPLMSDVEILQIQFYDGLEWTDSWDSTLVETPLPKAIKLSLTFASDSPRASTKDPLELIVPILTQAPTNQTNSATSGG